MRAAPFLPDYVAFAVGLVADLGGEDNITTAQRALIASTAEVRALRQKAGRNLLTRGLVQRGGDLRGAAKLYVALVNSERLGLLALGLERRARDVGTLAGYLAERDRDSLGATRAHSGGQTHGPNLPRATEVPPDAKEIP